jgi:hypothetical protein
VILFDEPIDLYHANAAIGSGDVRNMITSPRLFRDAMDGLCERATAALLFGLGSHCWFLEPHKFDERVVVRPDGTDFRTKAGMAWRAENERGRVILTAAQGRDLQQMQARMPREVEAIFAACRKEVTVRAALDDGDLAVQCRPDLVDLDAGAFWDLKTIDDIEGIDRAIWSRRYDVQLRWYAMVLAAETGRPFKRSALIFVEKAPPYRWRIVELDLDYAALADAAIDEALAQIRARTKSGCWDDPADLHEIATPPPWMTDRVPEVTDMQEA